MSRCCTKPCKRAAFRHARRVSEREAQRTYLKYTKKCRRKFEKRGRPVDPAAVDAFCFGLKNALAVEENISHAKAREYWFLRTPRLFSVSLVAIVLNIMCNEYLRSEASTDRLYFIVYGTILLMLSAYMLYQRLPDAVHAAMMRIGHSHYKQWKTSLGW